MSIYSGRCLCGQSHISVDIDFLDVYVCHCSDCQKWLGGMAMFVLSRTRPVLNVDSIEPSNFIISCYENYNFCPECGCPLWLEKKKWELYFIPLATLDLTSSEKSQLVYASELYTDLRPRFIELSGQYSGYTTDDILRFFNETKLNKYYR